MKKGFTLVELSIVLVIIGLLVGGILVAQSLIDSTKIQSFVRQVNQYDAAVLLFDQKYRGLPGDNNKIYASGDNNGLIEDTGGGTQDSDKFEDEVANFWVSLSQTGFSPDGIVYSSDGNGGVVPGEDTPTIDGFDDVQVIAHYWIGGAFPTGNRYRFMNSDAGGAIPQFPTGGEGAFLATEALAIDQKMDDGIASSGVMRALLGTGGLHSCFIWFGAGAGNYSVNEETKECSIVLPVGGVIVD